MVLLPILIKVAKANNLFVPKNYRRIHKSNVSALGGLAIFVSSTLSFLLFSDIINFPDYRYMIGSGLLMFALGFHDDLFEVNAHYKLLGQLLAVTLLVVFADVRIHYFQDIFNPSIGLSIDNIITVSLMIVIINAYNLIDGIDMLAAMVGAVILGVLGLWFFNVGQYDYSLALLSLAGSLFAFMIFNFSPAKIFMGDTGTMTIGLIMAVALIKFDEINTLIESDFKFEHTYGMAFSFIALIFSDLVRVAIIRIYKGRSPFEADRNHIHHLLLRLHLSHNITSFIIGFVIFLQIVISVALDGIVSSNIVLIGLNILYVGIFYAIILLLLKVKSRRI